MVVADPSDDVFDALRENRSLLRDAELRELALIAQACDESFVDETLAGFATERLIVGGAPGTACIGEFLSMELGGLLGVDPADNLGPLSRRVHRAKTAKLWQVEQWQPGWYTWTSPHGFQYEVGPYGTTALGRPQPRGEYDDYDEHASHDHHDQGDARDSDLDDSGNGDSGNEDGGHEDQP